MQTARVRRKKREDLTAQGMGEQPVLSAVSSETPTLAQAIEMREMQMQTAQQSEPSMGEVANVGKMTVKRKGSQPPKDADVFDTRIGGYGKSMGPQESGEAAVKRIMKVKRKGR